MEQSRQIKLIAAVNEKGGIGYQGKLPWHSKEDLKHFSTLTKNKTIVMGADTFLSIPNMPLKGRHHIVLSSKKIKESLTSKEWQRVSEHPLIQCISSVDQLEERMNFPEEYWIVGGQRIYEMFLKQACEIHLTKIENSNKEVDRFFPNIEEDKWELWSSEKKEDNGLKLDFQMWIPKNKISYKLQFVE